MFASEASNPRSGRDIDAEHGSGRAVLKISDLDVRVRLLGAGDYATWRLKAAHCRALSSPPERGERSYRALCSLGF
jgi:hypothetical protein